MLKKIVMTALCTIGINISAQIGDGVLAMVNADPITYYDVLSYNRYDEMLLRQKLSGKELAAAIEESRLQVAKELIDQKILLLEFNERGYKLPNFIIEERIDQVVNEQAGGNRANFISELEANGETLGNYRKRIHDRVAVNMMLNQFVYSTINIEDAEIEQFIKENKSRFVTPNKVRFSLLMLAKGGKYGNDLDKVSNDIFIELQNGKSFEDLVKQYSEGPFVSRGGDLGWMPEADVRTEFREISKTLPIKSFSNVITLSEGHKAIIKIEERQLGQLSSREKMENVARSAIRAQKESKSYKDYIAKLRKRNIIIENFK